jgi:glycopeptide antibiotics resistance protein
VFLRRKSLKSVVVTISRVLFILYIILLAYFLFFSERYGRTIVCNEYRYNLTILKEVRRFITYRQLIGFESFVVNIFGNIFAFAPFGFMLPIINNQNRKFWNVALLSLEFSLTVELLQLLFKVGIFDVDDIIMNTIGGMIGYFCFFIVHKIYRSFHNT